MTVTVLFRKGVDSDDAEEYNFVKSKFRTVERRTEVPENSLVIGRYSVLPFYKELELDLAQNGSKLINSYRQHQFIADMREWCEVLGDMTPKLYNRLEDLPSNGGPFVLKGQTNSKKELWGTHMFANTKQAAGDVWSELASDSLIGQQEIYARDYVKLNNLGKSSQYDRNCPLSEEYRFFILDGKVVCGAFYWASRIDELNGNIPTANNVPRAFIDEAINRIGDRARFYVIDIARTASGDFIVIELNDGQQSGLSMNSCQDLWNGINSILV